MAFPHTAISNFTHRPTAVAIRAQSGLQSSCYMWLKCHSLLGNLSACETEDSSRAGRGLYPLSPSETSSSREYYQQQLQKFGSAACAMIPNQQNFPTHDAPFNFSTMFLGCQIGQVRRDNFMQL